MIFDEAENRLIDLTQDSKESQFSSKEVFCESLEFENSKINTKVYESENSESINNGGTTDYYQIDPKWKQAQDIIEARDMNFSQGNILKSAFCFNTKRHSGTSYVRELNKIIWFCQRELERLSKSNTVVENTQNSTAVENCESLKNTQNTSLEGVCESKDIDATLW